MHHMIEAARTVDGASPVDDWLRTLERSRNPKDQRRAAEIAILFEDYADNETLEVPRELNDLRDGIRELKPGDVRLPFFEVPRTRSGAIRLTHGFLKRSWKAPRAEIDRALWGRKQDMEVDRRREQSV
jgi:phage-related protein